MNMVMAAVTVLVMLKTMMNSAFRNQNILEDGENEAEFDESPSQVSDFEYEYLNDLLENEDFDFKQLNIEDFEDLDFQKLITELNSNLTTKLEIMKHSPVLNKLLSIDKTDNDFEAGEAISDS